jgi:hypothetical protein
VVHADKSGDESMYGPGVSRHDVLRGDAPVPESAHPLIAELVKYSR